MRRTVIMSASMIMSAAAALATALAAPAAADPNDDIFINVIENAIKYSPDGGVVVVRMESGEDVVRIVVSDSGQGIPEGDIPKVFDRFYRSDLARSTSGSGLGLSIVKSVVDAHGGSVAVASAPGSGTSITISLPA